MGEPLRPTELRTHLFKVLDEVLETGVPREILRGGKRLAIVRLEPVRRDLMGLPKRKALLCTPEELEATTWDYEPDLELVADLP